MSIKANELDRSSIPVLHPSYKYHQLTPQTGQNTLTLTNTSNPETIFDIPDNVENLGESILTLDVLPSNEATAARFIYADSVPFFRDVNFYSDDTTDLMKQPFTNKYTNTVMRRQKRPDQVHSNDSPVVASSAGGDAGVQLAAARLTKGVIEGLVPPNNLKTTLSEAAGKPVNLLYNADQSVKSAAATTGAANNVPIQFNLNHAKRNDGVLTKSMFTEPIYNISSYEVGAALRGPFLKYRFKLKDIFPDSIIGLPFNQYFGSKMHLRFTWEIVSKIMWLATGNVSPSAGAANMTNNIKIENLHLFVAIEQNPTAIMDLKNEFNSGNLHYKVPYVISHMQRIEAGTNATMNITYTKAQGEKLKRIYVVPFHTDNDKNLVNDHNNIAGGVLSSYWTELNGVRTANANYDCVKGTDYTHLKHLIKGSCIDSEDSYYHNWVHEEKFIINAGVGVDQYHHNDGLDMNAGDITYTFTGELLAAKNFYVFAVFQRTIHINRDGITFSNN